jgi:fatty acid desaturase
LFQADAGNNGRSDYESNEKEDYMIWTIAVVLLALWALGLVTGVTISGFIHILLVVAIIVVLIRVISGKRLA